MSEYEHPGAQHYQDPGWFGRAAVAGGPGQGRNGIQVLRRLFVALVLGSLLTAVVLHLVVDEMGTPEVLLGSALTLYGLIGAGGAHWAARRPLVASDGEALAASFRANFFFGFALNESPLLVAFVFSLIREERWPYFLVLPLYLIGMSLMAPTRANLERRQRDIQSQGSPLSLGAALSVPARRAD